MQKYFTLDEVAQHLGVKKKDVLEKLKENLLTPSIYFNGKIEVVEVGGDGKPIRITGLMEVDGIRGLHWTESQVKGVNLFTQYEDCEPPRIIRMTEHDVLCGRSWRKSCIGEVAVFTQFEEGKPSKTVKGELLLPEQETWQRCRQYIPHLETPEGWPSSGIEKLAFDFSQVVVSVESIITYMSKQGREVPEEFKPEFSPERFVADGLRRGMPKPKIAAELFTRGVKNKEIGKLFPREKWEGLSFISDDMYAKRSKELRASAERLGLKSV